MLKEVDQFNKLSGYFGSKWIALTALCNESVMKRQRFPKWFQVSYLKSMALLNLSESYKCRSGTGYLPTCSFTLLITSWRTVPVLFLVNNSTQISLQRKNFCALGQTDLIVWMLLVGSPTFPISLVVIDALMFESRLFESLGIYDARCWLSEGLCDNGCQSLTFLVR